MSNSIGDAVAKMTARLDKIIEAETKTADLNVAADLLGEFNDAGTIKVAQLTMDGLGDYNRQTGFPAGDVDLQWNDYTLRFDRGREFSIDDIDDQERLKVVSANTMAEFERIKVIPEVDAVRFATLCEAAGTKVAAALSSDDAVVSAVLTAEEAIEDTGTQLSEAILYCTSAVKASLRKKTPYQFGRGDNPSTNFETYDDMKVVTVPSNRFYSAIDLLDGTTSGETGGGYAKHASTGAQDAAGVGINFMIVNPKAAGTIQRHKKLRYFAPDVNQTADAHKWQYRLFHDIIVRETLADYIYVHVKNA